MRNCSVANSNNSSNSGRFGGFAGFLRRPFAGANMSKNKHSSNFPSSQSGGAVTSAISNNQQSMGPSQQQLSTNNNNAKRRSTFGSRLSVHSLFFPNAYSIAVGGTPGNGAGASSGSPNANTNSALISTIIDGSTDNANRSTKMSRSTNDLQNPTAAMASLSNVDEVDHNRTAACISINRRGSTERLLMNNQEHGVTTDRVVVFLDSKSMSLAPSDDSPASRSGSASDHDQDSIANLSAATGTSTSVAGGAGQTTKVKQRECPLCLVRQPSVNFPQLSYCHHRSCQSCLVQYLHMEILESRVNVTCPECNEPMHPNDIYKILSADDPNSPLQAQRNHLIEKYEEFSVRRILMSDPDTRWCPAPDCSYAVIATGCAACPELRCQRPGCGTLFCYHCKMVWHPSQTCDEARAQRGSFATSPIHIDTTIRPGDIKACPRCRTYIVKMNDGSCNHMICALCGAEFCWLCLREISDLHYLSPSGCTFWGKKPWSRKKKLLWQLGMLVGAPVGIALVAGLAVPAIIFGVPVWVGRKVHQKLKDSSKAKRRLAIAGSVFGSVMMSPVLASMAVGVGVPIMLAYVYGVVPLSLCRNGSCGVTASSSGVRLDLDDDILAMTGVGTENAGAHEKAQLLKDVDKQDASTVTGFSMQSGSTQHKLQIQADVCSTGTGAIGGLMSTAKQRRSSMESGATASLCGERCYINYEEASTKALAGSTYCDDKSVHTMGSLLEGAGSYVEPDQFSMKGLCGSVGGAAAETKSSKSVSSGGVILGQPSTNVNADNASTVAMAGSICGVTVDNGENGQCSRCGGRKSSTSVLRTTNAQGSLHSNFHHHHHHHVHIDDQVSVDERESSVGRHHSLEPRVTRFADDPYSFESSEINLLDRHCGILPIDEESNTNTNSTTSKLLNDDQPTTSAKLSTSNLNYRQSIEKSSSLRRFLFLRSGTTSEDVGKRKRSPVSIDIEPASCSSSGMIDLKSMPISCNANDEKRCRLHRDECQCDDAEFLLLPPDAYIVQNNRFTNRRLSTASSRNGPMKKSRSWSALLLDSSGSGQGTSSVAAELWSTVRGAFGGGGGDADIESAYRPAVRNVKRTSAGGGFVQRLKPGRRATVSTSVANVATTSKKPSFDKKSSKLDVASSCTSLPDTYASGALPAMRNDISMDGTADICISLPNRQRTPSDSSRSKSGAVSSGTRRISTTLANFFKPSGEK